MEPPELNVRPRSFAEKHAVKGHACKIPFTHDRLEEVHYWWHQMARNYHEPDPFRYSLGAFIQASRSVSFMLQKERVAFNNFDWYQSWVERAKKDPVLSWLNDARTDVVHRQALQPHSWLEVRCINNPKQPGNDDNPIGTKDPFMCTHYYIAIGPPTDHTHEFSRLWAVGELEGRELLETCAEIYGEMSELVQEAHRRLGGDMATFERKNLLSDKEVTKKILPCMQAIMKHRVVRTALNDGTEVWVDEPPGLHDQ